MSDLPILVGLLVQLAAATVSASIWLFVMLLVERQVRDSGRMHEIAAIFLATAIWVVASLGVLTMFICLLCPGIL